jgi:hypothetical protein
MARPISAAGGTMKRVLGKYGDATKYFAAEDGRHFVGFRQDADNLKEHVRHLNDKVNGASSIGNKNGWRYAGSIPIQLVSDWCARNGYTINDFACDHDNAKKKFMAWFRAEYPKLTAQVTPLRPNIIVPATYKARKNALVEGGCDS